MHHRARCALLASHLAQSKPAAAQTAAESVLTSLSELPARCAAVIASAQHLRVDEVALDAFADTLTVEAVEAVVPTAAGGDPSKPVATGTEAPPSDVEAAALTLACMSVNFCYFPAAGDQKWWWAAMGGDPAARWARTTRPTR